MIVRSTFLPRTIGVLIQIAGLCYLANSFALFLAPSELETPTQSSRPM
jgi:hypothetical protein